MQKLLIIYPNQFGYHTDSYMYCKYLHKRYDITYVCFDQGFPRLAIPGVTIVYIPYAFGKIKRIILYFYIAIQQSKILKKPICFVVQFKFSGILPLFLSSQLSILDYRTGDLKKNGLKRAFINRLMLFDSLLYSRLSDISEGLRKQMHLPKKTSILPLGADEISLISKNYQQLHLLYVGAIHHRNIYQTIEGLGIFLRQFPGLKTGLSYTIIGFGNEEDIQQLNSCILDNNVQENISYLGRIPYNKLSPYFDKCTIGVSYIPITDYYQHQPATKTFEYALSGLFTIATATLENQKVIRSENGVLCQDTPESFAEALHYVYEHNHLFNEQEIRASLQEYHWKNIIDTQLIPILQQ